MRHKANTPEKEVLAALKAILIFQVCILNTHFTLRADCSSLKRVLENDAKGLIAKLIFARWQAMFSLFCFDIEHINGEFNSLPEYFTRENLQEGTRRISMTRTIHMKREWFPTTGDLVLGSIPRSDYFPGQPWTIADLQGLDVGVPPDADYPWISAFGSASNPDTDNIFSHPSIFVSISVSES